jgi:hypothetical protein
MRLKEEFLNEDFLKPYGFRKEICSWIPNLCTYVMEDTHAITHINGQYGNIIFTIPDKYRTDWISIPDIIYHMIKNGQIVL